MRFLADEERSKPLAQPCGYSNWLANVLGVAIVGPAISRTDGLTKLKNLDNSSLSKPKLPTDATNQPPSIFLRAADKA